jgi:glycosyl transferase family 25
MFEPQRLPIFVLTLASAGLRRAQLLAELDAFGLAYELVTGIDGTSGLPPEYEPLVDRAARVEIRRRRMTDGEYACTLSHLSIHRLIVARDLPEAIILEDDARIGSAFADLARGLIHVPGELALLDFDKGFFHRRGCRHLGHGLVAHRIAVAPVLATGYVMRQSAARYFLERGYPVRERADWPCDISKLDSYVLYPRIVSSQAQARLSHLDASRSKLRRERRAEMASGIARLLEGAFWRRRLRSWHRLRYRVLSPARPSEEGGRPSDSSV